MANVAHFVEDHSCSASCASFGVDRDAHEGKGSVEPSTPLPNRVLQGEGVWKSSMWMCRCAVAKTMSLMMTIATL